MINTLLRFIDCKRGLATIEAALILPILATTSLAAADAGMMMLTVHRLETGLAAGGAYLSRSRDVETDEGAAIRVAVTGYSEAGHEAIIRGWATTDVTVTVEEVANTGADDTLVLRGGNVVRVAHFETTYTYSGLGLLEMVTPGAITLTATHEERMFGGGA